jgi:hypothetical protein
LDHSEMMIGSIGSPCAFASSTSLLRLLA